MPGNIASARTYHALALGDMPATINYARQALDLFPEEEHLRRGTPAALLGLASWASGDLAEAIHSFSEAMTDYQKAGNILFVITGAYVLADMKVAQGHLREARKIYDESLQLAEEHGEPVLRGAADLYTGLCVLSLEQNDLEAAQKYLLRSKELGEGAALPRWSYRWYLAQAGIDVAEGNLDGALDALDEAERQYVRGPVPDIRSTAAMKARIWAAQGRVSDAQRWADEQDLTVDDDLSYLREFDHITLSRILMARYRRDQDEGCLQGAVALLERLLDAAEAGGRTGSVLEILIQQAMVYEAQSNIPAALEPLARALALAEPEGYVRLFVDEGRPMAALLKEMKTEDGRQKAYVSQLLAAFGVGKAVQPSAVSPQTLVEPLSERELEVLQLVAEGLSNREIAERLYLALSTVKGHNRVIYGKLNVSRRTEAVARARELGIGVAENGPFHPLPVTNPGYAPTAYPKNNTPSPYFRICTPIPPGSYAPHISNIVKGAGNVDAQKADSRFVLNIASGGGAVFWLAAAKMRRWHMHRTAPRRACIRGTGRICSGQPRTCDGRRVKPGPVNLVPGNRRRS